MINKDEKTIFQNYEFLHYKKHKETIFLKLNNDNKMSSIQENLHF